MIRGKAWIFGDDVDTDVIIPGKYLRTKDTKLWADHVMEGLDPQFASRVQKGDVIVAGRNFGSGSSREQAPRALKEAGVAAVVAKSFARIFYRNAINVGLPLVEADVACQEGDLVEVDLAIWNVSGLEIRVYSGNKAARLPDGDTAGWGPGGSPEKRERFGMIFPEDYKFVGIKDKERTGRAHLLLHRVSHQPGGAQALSGVRAAARVSCGRLMSWS